MASFIDVKAKYGHMASWAIWKKLDSTQKPKFGMGDISFFDSPETLQLNPNIVLVGLNISRKIEIPFGNFHPQYSTAHDYKIRYALENTMFSGAYMTDIIKSFEQKFSTNVMSYLRKNPEFEKENIKSFEEELEFIGSSKPILIAFGNDCFNILNKNLEDKYTIYKVPHYSSCVNKEQLRNMFEEISKKELFPWLSSI